MEALYQLSYSPGAASNDTNRPGGMKPPASATGQPAQSTVGASR